MTQKLRLPASATVLDQARGRWISLMSALVIGTCATGAAAEAPTAATMVPSVSTSVAPISDADALMVQIRRLAVDPGDLAALIRAGELATLVDDQVAAAAFFARANRIDPRNARVHAGEGRLLVVAERPGEALRRFVEAETLGVDPRSFASDRGLAFDLLGEQERAQRDYRLAMATAPTDENLRRYALSLAISGRRDAALAALDPLLRRSDRGAWRARAFVLAMAGDQAGADRIATMMMPPGLAAGLTSFFQRLPMLSAVDRAYAVHFGEVRGSTERVADARLAPVFPPLRPEPVVVVASVAAVPVANPRDRKRRGRRGPVEVAALLPPPPPPLPPPPAYLPQGQIALAALAPAPPGVPRFVPAAQPFGITVPLIRSAANPVATVPSGSTVRIAISPPLSRVGGASGSALPSGTKRALATPPVAALTSRPVGSATAGSGRGLTDRTAAPGAVLRAPSPVPPSIGPAGGANVAVASAAAANKPAASGDLQSQDATRGAASGGSSTILGAMSANPAAIMPASPSADANLHPPGGTLGPIPGQSTGQPVSNLLAARSSPDDHSGARSLDGSTTMAGEGQSYSEDKILAAIVAQRSGAEPAIGSLPSSAGSIDGAPSTGWRGTGAPGGDVDHSDRPSPGFSADASAHSAVAVPEPPLHDMATAPLAAPPAADRSPPSKAASASGSARALGGGAAEVDGPTVAARDDHGVASVIAALREQIASDAPASEPVEKDARVNIQQSAEQAAGGILVNSGPIRQESVSTRAASDEPSTEQAARDRAARTSLAKEKAAKDKVAREKAVKDQQASDRQARQAAAEAAKARVAAAEAAEAKKAALLQPARIFVQVAGGARVADLPKAWEKLRTAQPELFRAKASYTTPLRATNRLLTGPFKSDEEAQSFINRLVKAGLTGFAFTSEAGQKIEKLPR